VVDNNMDALGWLRTQLDGDENDLLRELVAELARRLMAAEVDAVAEAGWGGGESGAGEPPQRLPAAPV
jgi:hypothetical protein